jgi:hypothetical protein
MLLSRKIISRLYYILVVDFPYLLVSSILGIVLIASLISQAFANQMTGILVPTRDESNPVFTGIRFITLKYQPGSPLSKLFNGKSEHITFSLKGTEPGMSNVISAFNQVIAAQKQSPVQVVNASLSYSADITGQPDSAQLSYKVDFKPTISKYVLDKNSPQGAVVDLDWRSISINGPLIVDAPKYGNININYPIGLLQVTNPDLAQKFLNSQASAIMKDPLFNFQSIGIPMDRWHFLFDPTGSVAGAAGSGYIEQGGAKAVSVYSLGESSFREGTFTEQTRDATATIDNSQVAVHSSTPPPSAQIQIAGFSKIQKSGGNELAFVSAEAPAGTVTATGGFPLQVLLVLGGMMGAVAVFVLVKARK